MSEFPNLQESTIRHLKKAYREQLEKKIKKCDPQPVVDITAKPKGHPPILLDLDEKLIKFLKAIRAKGGVVNIHVVRATQMHSLLVTHPLPCIFRISASHVPG